MKCEESAMLSISTSNTPNRSKAVTKAILEHDQLSLKRQKLEFIRFPRFHHFICNSQVHYYSMHIKNLHMSQYLSSHG